jgi:hypothetical protein
MDLEFQCENHFHTHTRTRIQIHTLTHLMCFSTITFGGREKNVLEGALKIMYWRVGDSKLRDCVWTRK